jgi:hypothetical protein
MVKMMTDKTGDFPTLNQAQATVFADLALACIHRE